MEHHHHHHHHHPHQQKDLIQDLKQIIEKYDDQCHHKHHSHSSPAPLKVNQINFKIDGNIDFLDTDSHVLVSHIFHTNVDFSYLNEMKFNLDVKISLPETFDDGVNNIHAYDNIIKYLHRKDYEISVFTILSARTLSFHLRCR